MCDWKICPKVYHLSCVGRQRVPGKDRKWYCPWHYCVTCGKPAEFHCIHCPNAYCKTHNSALKKHEELGHICDEHKDDIGVLVKFYRRTGSIKDVFDPNAMTSTSVPETIDKPLKKTNPCGGMPPGIVLPCGKEKENLQYTYPRKMGTKYFCSVSCLDNFRNLVNNLDSDQFHLRKMNELETSLRLAN